ncbi:hypothetical protein BBJ28_00009420 [Nothophytophthora sp. Chile5]|nr:hypothetical protein BBJ28_00009420 [Nothophytophthora sp. Chile5]
MAPLGEKQVYMTIQSDWSASDEDSCWLDVYERTVQLLPPSDHELEQEQRRAAGVQTRASTQFQLPTAEKLDAQASLSESLSAAHQAEVVAREGSWIDVRASVWSSVGQKQEEEVRTVFQAPTESFDVPVVGHSEADGAPPPPLPQLHALDVSSDERFVVVGGSDGVCMLWDSEKRTQMLPLVGHVADVTCARFFPSSQVLLTGSLDFTLRIWGVRGRCAAVLNGHLGGVEDVAVLGKGRNVLSVLDDSPQQLFTDSEYPPSGDNEAETDGKVLFAGLDNGETLGVDVRARGAQVLSVDGFGGSILSCACTAADSASPLLLTGSEDGLLTVWDLRQTSSSPIHSIAVPPSAPNSATASSVWTAHGDGVCSSWSGLVAGSPHVASELTGPLYDAVRSVAVARHSGRVFTAGRDGRLREYIPHFLL